MRVPVDLRLYLVTDRRLAGTRGVLDTVAQAVAGGVTLVQVRSPDATARDFIEEARALKAMLSPLGVSLIVNDRVDVALAVDADGVHVGQKDIDPRDVRAMLGATRIIGLSVGSAAEWAVSKDMLDAIDYLGTGPVYATSTKSDAGGAIGPEGLAAMVARTRLPVVAIGGIGHTNAAATLATGCHGLAVVSSIMADPRPQAAARSLREIVDNALQSRGSRS